MLLFAAQVFATSETDVENAIAASGRDHVAGSVFIWFLCAVAFLKISQKIDSFMSSLGINVGRTGGNLLAELMVAGRAIGSAVRSFGGGSTAGNNQTEDVTHVNKTSFFEVTSQTSKYTVRDITDEFLPYVENKCDVNGDGEVTVADINIIIDQILKGGYTTASDVNQDGEVTVADINKVIDYILAGH